LNYHRASLSTVEHVRLDSYIVDIAAEARGTPVPDGEGNFRFGSARGALCVYATGQYHDFSGGEREHGRDALGLIDHLYPNQDAVIWARDWLARHPGHGDFKSDQSADAADDFAEVEGGAYIRTLYGLAGAVDGPPARTYIEQTRDLPLRLEDQAQLRWIPEFRGEEGALIAPMTNDAGELVMLMVTHVTPDGRKSEHEPCRITIRGAKRPGLCRLGTPGKKVIETEGLEKGLAARAAGADYVVVTGGVSNLGKAPLPTIVSEVVIARDADPAGSAADIALWRAVVRRLSQGLEVAVTKRPNDEEQDAPFLKDLDDAYRHDPGLVSRLLNGAKLAHGRLGDAVDGAIIELASRLDEIAKGRAKQGIARLLGITVGTLDSKIKQIIKERIHNRGDGDDDIDDGRPGKPLVFTDIEPWPDPIDGAELLTDLSRTIGAYVKMEGHQRDAIALWFVFAHAHDLRDYAPLLLIKSAIKRSGKTRLAEMAPYLTPRPLALAGLTAAFIERAIEGYKCTLIIDEADRLRKGNPALAEQIDAQLNRSFMRKGAFVGKNVPLPGGGYEPRLFSTWAPTLISGIGKQADTAEDRAVIIVLKRKLTREKVKQRRARDGDDLRILARRIARFVEDNESYLRNHVPDALEVDNDRAKDVWEPLLTIAEAAGGEWPERARKAGRALAGEAVEEEEESGVQLLSDIRGVFCAAYLAVHPAHKDLPPGEILKLAKDKAKDEDAKRGRPNDGPRLPSSILVQRLIEVEDGPYKTVGDTQKPLTQNTLARALREFKIRPGTIWLSKESTPKGYHLHSFEDAFARYLSEPAKAPSSSYPLKSSDSNRQDDRNLEESGVSEGFATAMNDNAGGSKHPKTPAILRILSVWRMKVRNTRG
jgi:Protein of unknown function (DUF3631)